MSESRVAMCPRLWHLPVQFAEVSYFTQMSQLATGGQTMQKLAAVALVLVALAALSAPAQACHHSSCCITECCAPTCAPTTIAWVDKVVTCYRPEWRERDVTCTVMRANYRDVVENHTCTVMVPVFSEQKQKIWVCNMVRKEVVKDVACTHVER